MTCRSSVRQAACVYSLMRPLRIGFRRICCVPTSVTAARGAARSSSGARAGRCPGAAGPCCSAAGIRPGRRAGVPRRGSARGRGARGAGCRRGVRRSRSAWTVVRRILAPVARKTASKERVKSGPRSRIRNLMSPGPLAGAEGEVAGLLHSPHRQGLRCRRQVHPAGAMLDEDQERRGAGSVPRSTQDLPHRGGRDRHARFRQFAVDPAVSLQRILPSQANDKAGDARDCRRAAGLAPLARVVLARGQLAVPGQQRRWRHGEDFGPASAGYERR